MRSSRSSFDSTRMLHQRASSDLFRFSAKPNQANGSAMPQLNSPVEAQRLHYKSAAPIPIAFKTGETEQRRIFLFLG
jgi:hypothetical protein